MRRPLLFALMSLGLAALASVGPAAADWRNLFVVAGVQGEDMLKMRAGPGLGYVVIVGLPNGAVVHVESCQLIGGTRWCKVALDQARTLKGFVSSSYLREK